MKIHIILSTTLRKYFPNYDPETGLNLELENSGQNIADLACHIGVPVSEIKFVMLNGRSVPFDTILHDGDRIAFFPPVGGG